MKIGCVYRILCLVNNRAYFGSSVNFKQRKTVHLIKLRQGKHTNHALQKDFNEFGENNFKFEIIEKLDANLILEAEKILWESTENKYDYQPIYLILPNFTNKEIERFHNKYTKKSDQECWLWKDKYGKFKARQKMMINSRVAFKIFRPTEWKDELIVCHKCDNPLCVNPNHLFLGTTSDNQIDRTHKGIGCIGMDLAKKIRQMYLDGFKRASLIKIELSKQNINLSTESINQVLSNKTFYDKNWLITNRKNESCALPEHTSSAKVNWNIVYRIRELYAQRITNFKIVEKIKQEFNVNLTASHISSISRNKQWRDDKYIFVSKDHNYKRCIKS